jgi:hypothetical protein
VEAQAAPEVRVGQVVPEVEDLDEVALVRFCRLFYKTN